MTQRIWETFIWLPTPHQEVGKPEVTREQTRVTARAPCAIRRPLSSAAGRVTGPMNCFGLGSNRRMSKENRLVSAILFDGERVDHLDDLPNRPHGLHGSNASLGRHRPAEWGERGEDH